MSIADNIKRLRESHGLNQSEFGRIAGVSDKAVSTWENGLKTPRMGAVQKLSDHFGIPKSEILDDGNYPTHPLTSNIIPMPSTYKVPLIGTIACGKPILAVEDADEVVDVPGFVHADFALRCKGDSMINARIYDGDIVYIRRQPEVENGQIAAVRIGDEATLKKVTLYPNKIVLEAANPLYDPFVYRSEEMNQVEILGKAVAFTSMIK